MTPHKVQAMVRAYDFAAFQGAARNGHLAVIEKLIEVSPYKAKSMV
jgi:hypothetical protein